MSAAAFFALRFGLFQKVLNQSVQEAGIVRTDGDVDFRQVSTVNLDEYVGLPAGHPQSYAHFMRENFFDHIQIDLRNTHIPNGMAEDGDAECRHYDATIRRIPKESMVLRFVKKYADDKTYAQLTEAVGKQDWETAFRASHTLKGVAQNLGFDGLYRAAFALTEEMRGGAPLKNAALYDAVAKQQQIVLDAVRQLA